MRENAEKDNSVDRLPLLAMRGAVVFPNMPVHFELGREKFARALRAAMRGNREAVLVTQKETLEDDPKEDGFYSVGVLIDLRQVLRTQDGVSRVWAEGLYRVKILSLSLDGDCPEAVFQREDPFPLSDATRLERRATMRCIKGVFEEYVELLGNVPREMIAAVLCERSETKLFEHVVFNMMFDYKEKQQLLENRDWDTRLRQLYTFLTEELDIAKLEHQLREDTQAGLEQSQRECYLREQMHQIAEQLGEDEESAPGSSNYKEKIEALPLDDASKEKLNREASRLARLPAASQEAFVIQSYLDTVLDLPWNESSKSRVNLKRAETVLERDHYGLQKVKQHILEGFAVRALLPDAAGQILCLVGPPGIGKTSVGRSIARALGRKYERVSLGGVRDESDIRGHRKTYVGAMPGRIIDALTRAGTNNPVILLDEVDKMGTDFRGDPAAALLEVLDSEQNHAFRDHYIDVPFDLSHVLFVTTCNTLDTVPAPLRDRMDIIELGSYTREEKYHIAKEHLLKKQMTKNGLKGTQCRIQDDAIYALIDSYTREAGVRELERSIATLCRKAAKKIVEGQQKKVTFSAENLYECLGVPKFRPETIEHEDAVGVVNGLAWTAVGGVLMPMEVLTMPGKGAVECTGSLGEVMKESAKLAVSYTRSVAKEYGIPEDFYLTKDLHIHAPEGAVPKDGPSAGVTMTTALISALSGRPVRGDVAMTGEITLHGRVLPIGGLREKSMAAYKAGIKTVIIPEENVPDLEEIDEVVKQQVAFTPAKTLDTVLRTALLPKPEKSSSMITIGNRTLQQTRV